METRGGARGYWQRYFGLVRKREDDDLQLIRKAIILLVVTLAYVAVVMWFLKTLTAVQRTSSFSAEALPLAMGGLGMAVTMFQTWRACLPRGLTDWALGLSLGGWACIFILLDYRAAAGTLRTRGWPMFIPLLDTALVCRVPEGISIGLAVALLLWLVFVELEFQLRFGFFDLPGTPSYDTRCAICNCAAPPCAPEGGFTSEATLVVALPCVFFSFCFTRRFARQVEVEQARLQAIINAAEGVAISLSAFDLDGAREALRDHSRVFPKEFEDAFLRILQEMATYRAYLPQACLVAGGDLVDACHEGSEDLDSAVFPDQLSGGCDLSAVPNANGDYLANSCSAVGVPEDDDQSAALPCVSASAGIRRVSPHPSCGDNASGVWDDIRLRAHRPGDVGTNGSADHSSSEAPSTTSCTARTLAVTTSASETNSRTSTPVTPVGSSSAYSRSRLLSPLDRRTVAKVPNARSRSDVAHGHRPDTDVDSTRGAVPRRANVSLIVLNMLRTLALVGENYDLFVTEHAAMLQLVLGTTSSRSGIIDRLVGDRFYVSFNASRRCVAHAMAAVGCAEAITHRACVRLRCAVATGPAVCASIGVVDLRSFAIIGSVPLLPDALLRATRCWPHPVVLTNATFTEVWFEHESCVILQNVISMKAGHAPEPCVVYELLMDAEVASFQTEGAQRGGRAGGKDEASSPLSVAGGATVLRRPADNASASMNSHEWMYSIGQSKATRWETYNRAAKIALAGAPEHALALARAEEADAELLAMFTERLQEMRTQEIYV